jgi:hypothetical protein
MSDVWCVRAEFGTYAQHFVKGGYVAIGWIEDTDLSHVTTREEIYPLYKQAHPDDTSNIVIGQQVGQIALPSRDEGGRLFGRQSPSADKEHSSQPPTISARRLMSRWKQVFHELALSTEGSLSIY